jgi:protein-S-isoprenylcysteine O-methyltransferase Ste14
MVVLTEERDLGEEYGENYREYTERVPWRLIPGVF